MFVLVTEHDRVSTKLTARKSATALGSMRAVRRIGWGGCGEVPGAAFPRSAARAFRRRSVSVLVTVGLMHARDVSTDEIVPEPQHL